MATTRAPECRLRGNAEQSHARRDWIPIGGLLLGAGWGSNQFTPMLLVYHARLGLSTATLEALFGAYAAGLIPGLLLGGRWSDTHGRRQVGVLAAVLSLLSSVSLIAGGHAVSLLFVGRLLAGVGSGGAFGAGTVWLREWLAQTRGATAAATGRSAAIAMTTGFALGPLVAGALAQWGPAPTTLPYIPHVALMLVVLVGVASASETLPRSRDAGAVERMPRASLRRFYRVAVPVAIWVFVAPAVAFALLPSVVGVAHEADGVALTAAITSLTALAGVLIQPVARRLEAGVRRSTGALLGLLMLAGGLALGALAAGSRETWLLFPTAAVLGSAYGLCLVAGLLEVQRIAPARSLGALTSLFYVAAYLGFAAPYALALASSLASYAVLLLITAGLGALTAVAVWGTEQHEKRSNPAVQS